MGTGIGKIGSIGIRRIKWTQPVPSWKRAEAWRNKMRASRERFQSINNAMTNAVIGAQGNLVSGSAELAIRAATKRMQDAALKRLEKNAEDVANRLDNLKTDLTV